MFERPYVFVLISVKIRIPAIHVFKQSTHTNSEQDKKMLVCIETVLVLMSIYVMLCAMLVHIFCWAYFILIE